MEKVYGHLKMARQNIARVLAEKVQEGSFSRAEASLVARRLMFDNPNEFYRLGLEYIDRDGFERQRHSNPSRLTGKQVYFQSLAVSIARISSGVRWMERLPSASFNWAALLAPMMGAVIAGRCSSQASAICATVA